MVGHIASANAVTTPGAPIELRDRGVATII